MSKSSYATNFTKKSHFGEVTEEFILDDARCTGSELSLFDCPHVLNTPDCGPGDGAGVVCANDTTPPIIQLWGGASQHEGNI